MAKVKLRGYICDGPMSGYTINPEGRISFRFTLLADGDYFNCVWHGQLAYLSYPYLQRGQELALKGRLHEHTFTGVTGSKFTMDEVVVNKMAFVLDEQGYFKTSYFSFGSAKL
jgi:hypothetical protein